MSIQFTISDINFCEQLFNMEKICFPNDYWSLDSIKAELVKENCICIIASIDDDLAGYIFSSLVCDESELNRVSVLPKYRNRNIAFMLINYSNDILKKRNCKNVFLEVRERNMPAINLYKKLGFKTIGIRNNYYKNPIENAVLMTLNL